jgi:hypothetical protein
MINFMLIIHSFVDNVAVHSFSDVVLTGYVGTCMFRGGWRRVRLEHI